MTAWYAIRVAPQREFAVEKLLKTYDLKGFCPILKKEIWRKVPGTYRKKKLEGEKVVAAFPGWIFAACHDPWTDILRHPWARHVTGVASVDGRPMPIPYAQISRLPGAPVHASVMQVQRKFQVGDTAEIMHGPFRDYLVEIRDIRGRFAEVMLPMLGARRTVTVSVEQLELA